MQPQYLPDSIGRLSHTSDEVSVASNFGYDPMGRIILKSDCIPSDCSYDDTQSARYDLAGNMTDLTYPDGHHITQTWDSAGRLASSQLVDVNGTSVNQSYLQSASYFPDGSPQVLTLGNGVQQIIGKNNRLQVQSMVASTPLPPFNSQPFLAHTYCYVSCPTGGTANNGNIWGITDTLNANNTQGFTYDVLSRISSFSLGGVVNQQYRTDSFGNMSPMAGANPLYSFDASTNRINNLPCAGTLNPYDAVGNQTCDTDPYGAHRKYSFDAESRVTQIAMSGSNTPFESYTYGADGNRVRKDNANGTYAEYVYFNGQPVAEKDQNGVWTDYIYANGRKIASAPGIDTRIRMQGTTLQTGSELGANIATPNITIVTGDTVCWQQYNGHAVGGINLQFSDGRQTAWHLQAYDGQDLNQDFRTGGWFYRCANLSEYANVNLINFQVLKDVYNNPGTWSMLFADIAIYHPDGTITPIYNGQSSLGASGINSVDPAYDSSFEAGVETVPVGQDPVVSSSDANALTRQTHFFIGDQVGTVQMEFSAGGWPVWKGEFTPFGQELDTQFTANNYKFTGKERDSESGLDYFGARYYASSMGRMMSPDPGNVGANPANPQSWNMYSYSLNNPLSFTDPTGLYVCADSAKCDSANDKAFATALSAARDAANRLTGGDKTAALKGLDAYGEATKDNGVKVGFDSSISGGLTQVSGVANGNKSDLNPNGQNISVTLNPNFANDAYGGADLVSHEGSHVADGSAWVASGFSSSFDPSYHQGDIDANHVQFNIMNSINNAQTPSGSSWTGAGLYGGSVKWDQGATFKGITPDLANAIRKSYAAQGIDDSKPSLQKGSVLPK